MSHRSLSHNRDFTSLWIGQVVSELGSRVSLFVFPLIAYALTGSAVQAALAESLHLLGMLVALLPAGVLADRHDRKRLMRAASGLGAALYAALATLAIFGALSLTAICVVALATGALAGVFAPAEISAVRDVVAEEDLPAAISQQSAREYAAALVGAPLGGVLYTLGSAVPFVTNACTYAFSWLMIGRIRTDLRPRRDASRSDSLGHSAAQVRRDLAEGFRFIWRTPFFRVAVTWSGLCNLTVNTMIFVAVLRLIQDGYPPAQIALVETVTGLAGIAGAAIAPTLVERVRTGHLAVVVAWSFLPLLVPMLVWDSPLAVAFSLSLGCFLNPAGNAALGSYRISLTPPDLIGRVQSTTRFVNMSLMPLAPVLGGVALARLGGDRALMLTGLTIALSALVPTLARSIRTIPRPCEWQRSAPREPDLVAR